LSPLKRGRIIDRTTLHATPYLQLSFKCLLITQNRLKCLIYGRINKRITDS
jgi:hypothetical protein